MILGDLKWLCSKETVRDRNNATFSGGAPLSRAIVICGWNFLVSGSIPVDVTDLSILFCNLIRSGVVGDSYPEDSGNFAGREVPNTFQGQIKGRNQG